ncbi:hypothetical protein BT93_D0364 [Corymbia citriodora subsp. variegata]|nr:hypothetical protein BT93_D0364 [Corymbia citriodora subsp. variegata]
MLSVPSAFHSQGFIYKPKCLWWKTIPRRIIMILSQMMKLRGDLQYNLRWQDCQMFLLFQ